MTQQSQPYSSTEDRGEKSPGIVSCLGDRGSGCLGAYEPGRVELDRI